LISAVFRKGGSAFLVVFLFYVNKGKGCGRGHGQDPHRGDGQKQAEGGRKSHHQEEIAQ